MLAIFHRRRSQTDMRRATPTRRSAYRCTIVRRRSLSGCRGGGGGGSKEPPPPQMVTPATIDLALSDLWVSRPGVGL